MSGTAAAFRRQLTEITALTKAANTAIEALLTLARETDPEDRAGAEFVLELAELIGRDGQAREGQLTMALAEAHRLHAHRGGLVPWISTHLDVTPGAARGLAQSAREIGHLPELTEPLSSGRIGATTIRALTRTANAVKGTEQNLTAALAETLDLSAREGVAHANRHVPILEETVDPGSAEQQLAGQRARSFLKVRACQGGMTRFEVLLDDERATTVRTALDQTVSALLRARQYDGVELAPADVKNIEQLQAHALTRFAEVFLTATPEQREVTFTPQVLYTAPLDEAEDAGLARTPHDVMVPRSVMAPRENTAAHLLEYDTTRQPVRLDSRPLDQNFAARLASPDQRIALAWRDKTCTYPGCSRPVTWALHARHVNSYLAKGPTVMWNLILLCAAHHQLAHHPDS